MRSSWRTPREKTPLVAVEVRRLTCRMAACPRGRWRMLLSRSCLPCPRPAALSTIMVLAFTTRPTWRLQARRTCQGGAMILASSSYSYPVLGAFWTIFMIFLWVIWFWVLITIFIDIFRSHDLSGWAKAAWFIFVLILPLLGVLVYLIARGNKMQDRWTRQAQQQDQQ